MEGLRPWLCYCDDDGDSDLDDESNDGTCWLGNGNVCDRSSGDSGVYLREDANRTRRERDDCLPKTQEISNKSRDTYWLQCPLLTWCQKR